MLKNKIIFISILIFLMIGLSSISAADVDGLNTDDSSDGNVDNFAVDADALTTAEDTSVIENDDNVVEYDEPTAVEKRKSISDGGLKYVNEGNVLSDDDYTIKTYLELNTYNLSSDNPHSVNIYNDSDYVAKLYTYTEAGGSVSLFIGKNEDDAEEIFTSPIQELDKEIDSNDTNYSYYYIRPTDISIAEVPDIYYVLFKYDIGWFSFDSVEGYVHFVEDSRHVRVEAPYEIVIGDDLNSFINVYVEGTRGYLRVLVDGIEIINDSVYNLRYINETDEFRYYIPVFLDYLSVGTHTYNVSYYNGNWDNVTISDTIDVTYLFEVYPNSDEVYCGDNVTFTIILPFDAIGDEIKVNNKTYDINLEYGLAHLTLSDFELGENILVFSYKDQFYDEKSCLVVVDVEPYLYIPELVLCKGDEKIVLRVPSDAQGKLNISTLDEYDWYFVDSVDVVDGEAVYSFDDYPWIIGSHDVLVEFDGDYNLSEETVIKIIPNVLLDERVIDEKLYVLADIIGVLGNVTIFVNDVNWTTVDVGFDGKINVAVPFSELEEGINSITLRHDGDDIDNDPFYYYDEWGERVPYVYEYEYVHKEKKTATDLQDLIDNAEEGSVVDLGNFDYVNVSNVNITKNITLKGDGTTITSAGDGSPIFNIVPKSQNGPDDVNITGILFNLQNGDVIVNAIADNATDNNTLDVANINISNNAFSAVDDNVVTESVVILNLQSEKGVLSPNGEISISNNLIEAGTIPFSFDVTSVSSGEGINIVPLNITPEKKATVIEYSDMATTAFDYNVDDRVGEYFRVVLKDSEGNALVNKPVQIGFNGVVYNEKNGLVTDENGSVKLQINLGYKGTYTFAICFLGDYDYNASFVVAKITVNLQKPTLSVPNKSYAASAKTKTLTATFKSSRGNAIAGKKVTFKLNGKTYSATTNANGVAAVNVSLNTKGTYSFTVKFAGSSTYAAVNKSAKLTIK